MQKYKKSIPLVIFSLYFVKICFQPVTLTEAAILLILGGVASFYEFKGHDQKISDLEKKLSLYQQDVDSKLRDLDGVKSQVAGIKLASNYRTQAPKI